MTIVPNYGIFMHGYWQVLDLPGVQQCGQAEDNEREQDTADAPH